MKLFDPRAALAEIEKQARTPATSATSATQTLSNPSYVANVADVAAPQRQIPEKWVPDTPKDMRHGFAINGHPKTWTGKIVSMNEWRQLSEWEKHGSTGKHWNGLKQQWEAKL